MKRLPVAEEDKRSVGEWYARWDKFVAEVDFVPVREMFAEDVVAFGSKVEMMTSQAQLEREQWRHVWPSIEDYRYDLSTLEVVTSPDRLMAMGAVMFRSTGLHPDGTNSSATAARPARSCAPPSARRGSAPIRTFPSRPARLDLARQRTPKS